MNTLMMYANQIGEEAIDIAVKAAKTWDNAKMMKKETEKLIERNKQLDIEGEKLKTEYQLLVAEGERLVAENERLKAEGERLVAEGERLKAEGIEIEERGKRNKLHKRTREYYISQRDNHPAERRRIRQVFIIKHKLDEKIKKVVSGYIFKKSLNKTESIEEIPVKFKYKEITNIIKNAENKNSPQ